MGDTAQDFNAMNRGSNSMNTEVNDAKQDPVQQARELLAKATPGPWEVLAADDYFVEAPNVKVSPPKYVDANLVRPAICMTIVEVSNQVPDCGEANANLIAATPELLSALCDEVERPRGLVGHMQLPRGG